MRDGRGKSPGTQANYFKKGESGNPTGVAGKRHGSVFNIPKELRGRLLEVCPYDEKKRIWGEVIVDKALWMACFNGNGQGSINAMSEIFDRLLGRPMQQQTLDVNINQTTTEQVQDILHSLSVLKGNGDDPKSTVN